MASISVFSPLPSIKQKRNLSTSRPLLRSRSSFSFQRVPSNGGSTSSFACSTSNFHRRHGFIDRQRKSPVLQFGVDDESVAVVGGGERDWSQILSALLPFVVAVTAVAALSQPSTFTWWGSLIGFCFH